MPFNVLGPDRAVDALRRNIEAERARDPSFPLSFMMHREGPVLLDRCEPDITPREHKVLLRLSKRHPAIAIVTGHVDWDSDTGEMVLVELLRYSKGRRRTVASFRAEEADHSGQQHRLLVALLRYERRGRSS